MFEKFLEKVQNLKLNTRGIRSLERYELDFIAKEMGISVSEVEKYQKEFLNLPLAERKKITSPKEYEKSLKRVDVNA